MGFFCCCGLVWFGFCLVFFGWLVGWMVGWLVGFFLFICFLFIYFVCVSVPTSTFMSICVLTRNCLPVTPVFLISKGDSFLILALPACQDSPPH